MKFINGGVCAAQGFSANGIHCGIRKNKDKKDLSLIFSGKRAACAAVYTTNLVKGAPIAVTKENISDGYAQAIICNSGNANTCNADGPEIAHQMCTLAADALGISAGDVVVASTGVIGQPLSIEPIASGIGPLASGLENNESGSSSATEGIMTTDTVQKTVAVEFEIDGKTCRMGGIAKGSGMIHPNMATMLVFITSDVSISPELLKKALSGDIQNTFNMLSIDGDTSTNDMVVVMANGLAGNEMIESEGEAFNIFMQALNTINVALCRMIAADGEGATKLLECKVTGASSEAVARCAAKSVICSSLLKAAMFGADANWGRVMCAIGYCGMDVDISRIDIAFSSPKGIISVCEHGAAVDFSEEKAKEILLENEIDILVDLHDGDYSTCAWGCDLTYDYVKINGDYRT